MIKFFKSLGWTTKASGRLTIDFNLGKWICCIHLLPRKEDIECVGFMEDWYDGPLFMYSAGFLFQVVWSEGR